MIATDAITGGGYLFIDSTNHKYSGVAQLTFKDKINLNALGILQTVLPNNQPGYSFLLLITAEFSPIQLGFGFTLNGVGGLVGINRRVDTDFLRGLIRTGDISQLLFPANVMNNPSAALSLVDNAFPAEDERYVFGLMAKIGWGVPTLITLDVALIIELPAPVRLAILGILRATLPDADHPILRLRADFLGTVDFATKRIAFDATLHDSGLLWMNLSGDMAFRLYQGNNPVFVLTAGGFHPQFQPPANANLAGLQRLTLRLADSNDFKLILTSYFAVTSNTVQFGSRLDLYVLLISSCTLEGYLYFDALFQFNPFHVDVAMGGGVAIKWDGDDVLSLNLRLNVTGPGPWHVRGEVEFELLWISHTFHINETIGNPESQPALPDTNVRALLAAAIADTSNWEMAVPSNGAASPVVLRPATPTGNLLIDPNGILTFQQKVVPLGYQISRYGNTNPTQGNRFDISAVVLGVNGNDVRIPAGGSTRVLSTTGGLDTVMALINTQDYFAPGQYRALNDGQRLSSASFQPMKNGFRLYGPGGYAGGPGAIRGVEYELIVVLPRPTGNNTGSRASATEDPAGAAPVSNATTVPNPSSGEAIGGEVSGASSNTNQQAPVLPFEDARRPRVRIEAPCTGSLPNTAPSAWPTPNSNSRCWPRRNSAGKTTVTTWCTLPT